LPKPQLALLTSFCFDGLARSAELLQELDKWPGVPADACRNIEIYAMMQEDVDSPGVGSIAPWHEGFPTNGGSTPRNALHALASAKPETLAAWLRHVFAGRNIVAISSFLPEIMAHDSHPSAHKAAIKALNTLVETAALLHSAGHPVQTVELVGGSLVDGLWLWREPGMQLNDASKTQYAVNRLPADAGLRRLLGRIESVAKTAADSGIRLSLEMEPGSLFAVGGLDSLRFLAAELDARERRDPNDPLVRTLGFNLDVPHWGFLSRIDRTILRQEESIYRRILHAHISDHWIGHVADSRTGVFHNEIEFKDWLRLIAELPTGRDPGKGLPFSGYLTCELECVSDLATVAETLIHLEAMLDHWC
jgi:hypothetical protein